jgi:ATP-binding cassette subfamily B protein
MPSAEKKPSLRQRFNAMRNVPPFLRLVWKTSPALTLVSLGLRLIRALLPVAMLYVGKLIIDSALQLSRHDAGFPPLGEALASGLLNPLLGLLALELGLAIVSDLLGRMVAYADALLSELFANATSIRLMEHAATLDLEDFEDPDLQDKLDRARRQTMGRMNLMSQLFGQVQDAITVVSLAVGLLVYAPWLILLLALALVPAFIGESHFNAAGYSLNFQWTPERRQLDYLRQLGASVETAKEVKIYNLHRFLVERTGACRWRCSRPTGRWPGAVPCGAPCWPRWARWVITPPTPTSPGARCAAISRSAT